METDGEASVDLINILSAVAALLSALYAHRSNVIAKKALQLSWQEFENKQSNFILYLIEAFRWKQKEGEKKKLLLFNLTINNKSENKNSFKATLEITYLRKDDSMAKAVLEHNPDFQKLLPLKNLTVFPRDIRIEEKSMESKWLIFEQINFFDDFRIEGYKIRVADTENKFQTIETFLIKDIQDENN